MRGGSHRTGLLRHLLGSGDGLLCKSVTGTPEIQLRMIRVTAEAVGAADAVSAE